MGVNRLPRFDSSRMFKTQLPRELLVIIAEYGGVDVKMALRVVTKLAEIATVPVASIVCPVQFDENRWYVRLGKYEVGYDNILGARYTQRSMRDSSGYEYFLTSLVVV